MNQSFGYTRVSTVKQGEGVSLQEQKDAIQKYAQAHGLAISVWFEERETAAKQGRPKFNEMIRLLRNGKADGVIIHKIDRSARNLRDWADLGELLDRGIAVHFAGDSLDLHSRGGRLSADIQAVVAADYIRNLREETKKGIYGRLKQGLYPIPAPVGYLDQGSGKPKIPDPVMAPLIRKAFELYASQQFNLDSLVEELHRLGLRNRRGGNVSRNGLSTIIKNPFYIGLMRIHKTNQTFSGIHEPIVSKPLFDRVQNVLNGKTNTRIIQHDFLFRRLLTCGYCSYSLIGEKHKEHVYYRCQRKECPMTTVREDLIEEQIGEKLKRLQFNSDEIRYLKTALDSFSKDWGDDRERMEKSLTLSLNQSSERLHRLTDAFIDRMIDKNIFENRKETILLAQVEIQEKLRNLKEVKINVPDRLHDFIEFAKNLYPSYFFGFSEEKRDLLKILTSNRIVEGKNLVFMLKNPFNLLENQEKTPNGVPYRATPRKLPSLLNQLIVFFSENPDFSLPKKTNSASSNLI